VRQHDLADAVCIVEITGEGEPVTPAAIEEAGEAAGALLVRVTDRREIEDEAEIGVSFADPDEAVSERVAEMGLSTAARDVDETVRESKVADSNVREEVKNRVNDLLGDDPAAFEPAEGDGDDAEEATDDATEPEVREDAADDPTPESDDDQQGTMEEYL
jgi:exonuclease SbcD